MPKPGSLFTTFPDFNNADDNSIIEELFDSFEAFNELSLSGDTNALVDFFERLINSCIRQFIPLKTKKTNPSVPWMNRDILHLSRRVNRLRRSKLNNNPDTITKFNLAKELRRMTNSARDFYYRVQLQTLLKSNPKKFWRSILPKSILPSSFTSDGETLCDAA